MATITGGELVVRQLKKAGVDTLFGLHGAHIDTIFQACRDHDVRIIDTRHEAAAGHAAEGYARTACRLGVALVTAGGGFTNAVTSIANAYLDRTPVLFITGSGAIRDAETNTLQAGIDQVAIASPITKWAHRIERVEQIPRLLAQAIRVALGPPRGPVLIDIPWDVLTERVEESSVELVELGLPSRGAVPHPKDVEAALDVLRSAQRPVIVVGSEASRADAGRALQKLVACTGIPVFADYEGLRLLSGIDDAMGGLIQGLYTFRENGAAPDAVLLLGTRFGLNTVHGSGALLPREARIAQVDPDPREIGRLQPVALGIVADVGSTLDELASKVPERPWPDRASWRARVRALVAERRAAVARRAERCAALHPLHASEIVARHVNQDVVVVADGALTYLWLSEVISGARPHAFLCHGYLGSMGVGMGVALGAQTAAYREGRRTVLVTGDGAVGYSLAEFDTMVRQKLPVIVIVMNNRSWGATLHFQQLAVGPDRVTGTLLENGAYHEVARALGVESYEVDDAVGLEAALTSALGKPVPACINVHVDRDPIPPEELILIGKNPF
jgi:acetolactate synthase-1/2/3 large subunit